MLQNNALVRPVGQDSSAAAAAAQTNSKCKIKKKLAKNFDYMFHSFFCILATIDHVCQVS